MLSHASAKQDLAPTIDRLHWFKFRFPERAPRGKVVALHLRLEDDMDYANLPMEAVRALLNTTKQMWPSHAMYAVGNFDQLTASWMLQWPMLKKQFKILTHVAAYHPQENNTLYNSEIGFGIATAADVFITFAAQSTFSKAACMLRPREAYVWSESRLRLEHCRPPAPY